MLGAFFGFLDVKEVKSAAALWDVPALILGDRVVHGPLSMERLEALLGEVYDGPEPPATPDGFEMIEPMIKRLDWIAERVAVVDARWPRKPRGGMLADVDGTTFLVRIDEYGQPRIRGLLLHSSHRRPALSRSSLM